MEIKHSDCKIVAISGGFDPIHIGHIRMMKEAKQLGDYLIVILNNDHWLKQKKGFVFMPQQERCEVISSISYVDEVVISNHPPYPADMSICHELEALRPHIFANGGDRKLDNIPEVETCKKIQCKMVFNVGSKDKIQSSSWLLDNFLLQQGITV